MYNKKRLQEKGVFLENEIFSHFEYHQLEILRHLHFFFSDIISDPVVVSAMSTANLRVRMLDRPTGTFATSSFLADPHNMVDICREFGVINYGRTAVLSIYCQSFATLPIPANPGKSSVVSIVFKVPELELSLDCFTKMERKEHSDEIYLLDWHGFIVSTISVLEAKKTRIEHKLQCNVTFQQEGADVVGKI